MKLYNAKKPVGLLVKFVVLLALTAGVILAIPPRATAQDTDRDNFITTCRLTGGSAITKLGSKDVYCASRPVNVYVEPR